MDRIRFYRIAAPTTEDVERIVERIADRVEAWLAKQGYADDEPEVAEDPIEDGLALVQAASLEGRAAIGSRAGRKARRIQLLGGKPHALPPRCATCDGYTVHAGVVVKARDRDGLERLSRYLLRPPLAKSRLELRDDGSYVVRFKRAWSDGTQAMVFSRTELLSRLAALVPPPKRNLVTYHGVLGARAAWRSRVVPRRTAPKLSHGGKLVMPDGAARKPSRWTAWAALLARVFHVDGWACPNCDRRMTLRAVIEAPASIEVYTALQAAAARAPPAPASAAS